MYFYRSPDRPGIIRYDRDRAVAYAHKWAYGRNPRYYDFTKVGGDCTNFASQVLYAGSGIMNYTPTYGWYYTSSYDRTASWTGVNFFYKFLTGNEGRGPYAEITDVKDAKPGDIIQLSFSGGDIFHHSPVIVQAGSPASLDNILIATHTGDRDYYPVTNYSFQEYRIIHILGARR